ncbi:DUF3238 domain-containing protein [Melghirimyces algeriensis]|uniref:Fibronectin type-III domain-containing protein n=1 Tax=Melghirimyces algeriensis TaxID=910412 RepID=A0A521CR17_9BACL|nr:DUF3238 domain-containing protein [Melghirimyces algeriensis]SMO61110.1 Protein of unknown function [Melghirimyces algeriensis]
MRKLLIVTVAMCLAVTTFFVHRELSANPKFKVKHSKYDAGKIQLKWENRQFVEIIMDDKKIWEGKGKEFSLDKLKPGYRHEVKVVNKNDSGKVNDVVVLYIATPPNPKEKKIMKEKYKNDAANVYLNAEVSIDSVKLNWSGHIPDSDGVYDVFRNGKKIGETRTNFFTDTEIKPKQRYRYEILGKKKLHQTKIEEVQLKAKKQGIKIKKEDEPHTYYTDYSVGKYIETLSTNLESEAKIQSPVYAPGYMVRYNTFIPNKLVKNPYRRVSKYIDGVYYFGGDNRGFNFFGSYRTQTDMIVTFHPEGTRFDSSRRRIGTSTFYNKHKRLLFRDRADNKNIRLDYKHVGSDNVSYRLEHEAEIPYSELTSPAIDYDYDAIIYKNGNLSISGCHDRAPSHEIYIATYPGDTIREIYRHSNQGFKYLFGFPQKCFDMW